MTARTVVFDDWSGGERGTLGSRLAGKRGGMFAAKNMRVYRNGWIGPRAGVKSMSYTPPGGVSGGPKGLAYVPFTGSEVLFFVGPYIYNASATPGAATTLLATLGGTPAKTVRVAESTRRLGSKTYFSLYGLGSYSLEYGGPTLTILTNAPAGRTLELYKDRLVAGGQASAPQRVFYSDAQDFATWSASQYFEVGSEYPAYHLIAQRDGLTLLMQALIWRLTGTLGSTDQLRQVSHVLPSSEGGAVLDSDLTFYIPNARSAPVVFDAGLADERRLAHLEWSTAGYEVTGGIALANRDLLFLSAGTDERGLLRTNGAWTFHTFTVSVSAAMTRFGSDKFLFLNRDSTPTTYVLDTSIDRPGFAGDTYAQPGDASTTALDAYLHLPEWWADDLSEVTVRSVVIDFVKYQTGGAVSNNITATVRALNRYQAVGASGPVGSSGVATSTAQSWTEAGSSASTGGTEDRVVLNFGDQGAGGGFEIYLDAIKGVAIRSVTVLLDEAPTLAG